jgi:hypothetical protein
MGWAAVGKSACECLRHGRTLALHQNGKPCCGLQREHVPAVQVEPGPQQVEGHPSFCRSCLVLAGPASTSRACELLTSR